MTIFKIVLSLLFLLAGSAKLLSAKPIKEQFEEFGLSKPAMMGVGALEVLGAIGLQFNNLALYAAIGLLLLMIGAVVNHVKVKHPVSKIAPSFLLTIALGVLLFNMI